MFARVRVTNGVPEKVDEGVRQFRDVVVPSYKNVAGFKGGYMLVDRAKGKLIGVTLWATEAGLHSTEATSRRCEPRAVRRWVEPCSRSMYTKWSSSPRRECVA